MAERIDVRMPDGTIVRNVPRGTPKAEIEKRWKRASSNQRELGERGKSWFAPVDAAVRGAADMLTFGLADEIAAGADTINPFSRNSGWQDGFGDAYQANLRRQRGIDKFDERNNSKSRFAGQVGGAILPAFATGGATLGSAARASTQAPKVAQAARVARAVKPTAVAAAQGGAYAFGSTDGDIKTRMAEVPEGALWGAGGDLAGRAVGRVASGLIGGRQLSPSARKLVDEDVLLTPGMRGGPVKKMIEDKVLGSLPFIDEIPAQARARSFASLRKAASNRVLEPLGRKVDDVPELAADAQVGNEFFGNLQNTVYGAYDDSLENLSLGIDPNVEAALDDVMQRAGLSMVPDEVAVVGKNISDTKARLANGPVGGKPLRETVSGIRTRASKNAGDSVGDALWEIDSVLDDALNRQNPGPNAEAYRNARQSVSMLKRVNDAASRPGVLNGEFGPTQFRQAVTRKGYGTSMDNIASGEAPMLDLANAAADVMRVQSANSGTIPRALATGGLLSATGAATAVDPVMGALVAGQTLGYVPGLDRLLQDIAVNRGPGMRAAGDAIRRNNRTLGMLGTGGALGLYGQ